MISGGRRRAARRWRRVRADDRSCEMLLSGVAVDAAVGFDVDGVVMDAVAR